MNERILFIFLGVFLLAGCASVSPRTELREQREWTSIPSYQSDQYTTCIGQTGRVQSADGFDFEAQRVQCSDDGPLSREDLAEGRYDVVDFYRTESQFSDQFGDTNTRTVDVFRLKPAE